MSVIIKTINSVTSQGVSFSLNKAARLNDDGMLAKEWYVSWDKVGRELFGAEYTDAETVKELDTIRGDQ